MLFVIGLGLGDAKDITVKGLEIVKSCELIYLEAYTSILTCGKKELVNIFVILKINIYLAKEKVFDFRKSFMENQSSLPIVTL